MQVQVVGVFLLIISVWMMYCGVESFNPLALAILLLQNGGSTQAIIAAAKQEVSSTNASATPAPDAFGLAANIVAGNTPGAGSTGSTPGGAADASVLATQANSAEAKAAYQSYAQAQLASKYKLTDPSQFASLVKLWNQESGWNPQALNKSSGAFGIVQSLPASKLPQGRNTNAQGQIDWGLSYIMQRYGSPNAAWAHEVANNWY